MKLPLKTPLILSLLVVCLTFSWSLPSHEWSFAALSKEVLRDMLLTPDGKDVNADVLEVLMKKLVWLNNVAASRDLTLRFTTATGNLTKPALDNYVTVGNKPSSTDSLEFSAACDVCASMVHLIGNVATIKPIFQKLQQIAKLICPAITGGFTQDVCKAIVDNHAPIVEYVLPTVVNSPYTLCATVFSFLGCGARDHMHTLWTVPIPDRLPSPVPPTGNPEATTKDKITVLWMTDVHIDLEYEVGSVASCTEPLCCRSSSVLEGDANFEESDRAGKWGDYRHCDLPLATFEDMLQHINKTQADEIDVVMIGGDLQAHDVWMADQEANKKIIDLFADKINEYLPGKPVYYTAGNHEAAPTNYFPLPGDNERFSTQWLYDKFAEVWTKGMGTNATEETIRKAAYYTTLIKPGWRLVSLNSIFEYTNNAFLFGPAKYDDPYDQLQWLADVLLKAEKDGERVQIITHLQPGCTTCFQVWSWNYYRIIDRFADIITGQFHGHVHTDFFVVYHDAETLTQPKSVGFVSPSVTPYKPNNMGYRLYDFDPKTYQLLDYRQYYGDLEAANSDENSTTVGWKFEYSAKEAYSLPDMSPASWADFSKRMKINLALLRLYRKHYRTSLDQARIEPCGNQCRRELLCETYGSLAQVGDEWCEYFYPSDGAVFDDKRKCSTRFLKRP